MDSFGTTIAWTVDDFFSIKYNGTVIYSPNFKVGKKARKTTEWRLRIYPCGFDGQSNGFVSLFLQCLSAEDMKDLEVIADYRLSICNKDGVLMTRIFEGSVFNEDNLYSGFPKFIEVTKLNKNDGPVVIRCSLKVKSSKNFRSIGNMEVEELNYRSWGDFSSALWEMRMNNKMTDVELKVRDVNNVIACHKLVLASRSKVMLKAMKSNLALIKCQRDVIVCEYGFKCMMKLVEFVYLGTLDENAEDMADIVCELLLAADFYNIQGLKKWCENFMIDNATCHNVFDILKLAWKFSNETLILKCIEIFKENAKDINVKEYENIFKNNHVLGAYLFHKMSLNYEKVVKTELKTEDLPLWKFFRNKQFTDHGRIHTGANWGKCPT